jgi:hypothetical protein
MPDYKNGKIYKVWSPQGNEIYIGSTIQPLYARLSAHKTKGNCNSKILFEKYDDVRIELIECVPCDNKEELTRKEGEYIRNLDCVNRKIAGRTQKESNKEWCENNKEKIKEYKKEYYKEYYEKIKEQKKEYRENNKEKINEYHKEYRENNKEKIKEYHEKKITCECGRTFRIDSKVRHERSKVHQAFICASAGNGEASISVPTIPGT